MRLLREMGYTRVRHYLGGLTGWQEQGGALEAEEVAEEHDLIPLEMNAPDADRAGAVDRPTEPVRRQVRPSLARAPWSIRVLDAFGNRSVGELLAIWLSVVVACGIIYWLAGYTTFDDLRQGGTPIGHGLRDLATAEYFSFVTATSVGFGDVVPTGLLRIVAIVEAMAGLVIFGSLISKFVSRRQDRIIAEIHQTTFEEGMSRVRTNLHLVFTELQNIETACEQRGWPRERMLMRVESAALVLVGELRVVRGLLYRPRQLPQESDLEGILVGVTLALQQLIDLLGNVPAGATKPARLEGSLRTMAALARDICGECVPRVYEPHMIEWMDRIQGLAGRLTAA